MSGLTTHVLDTMHGRPAEGVAVRLYRLDAAAARHDTAAALVASATTNRDGRLDAPILAGEQMTAGRYRLEFDVGAYFRARGVQGAQPAFLETVPIDFGIAEPASHYHVPLVATPWSYSTYRGS